MTSHLDGSAAPYYPTSVQDAISDDHDPWDAEQMAAGQWTIGHWGDGDNHYPQGLRTQSSSNGGAYPDYSLDDSAYTMAVGPAAAVYHGASNQLPIRGRLQHIFAILAFLPGHPLSKLYPNGAAFSDVDISPSKSWGSTFVSAFYPSHDSARYWRVIHAICRPQPCPSGYEVKRFTHEMSLEMAQEYSIPYEDSGQNTFRGDTIKIHLESYHPNITAVQKVVCVRKSHQTSKCPPGNEYEQFLRNASFLFQRECLNQHCTVDAVPCTVARYMHCTYKPFPVAYNDEEYPESREPPQRMREIHWRICILSDGAFRNPGNNWPETTITEFEILASGDKDASPRHGEATVGT
ncbi:hypothetical protein ARMSODRAFT_1070943 [Armillaria solidipes]|uniref:Uncharacterized protein n=1 Tax=Armillaria solidipes TaxID=1076256 RepID=A0A2H3AM48_9AGAR|nr:hypothetical protein ARMSODRAFT_1070943 [Armillaria solidipes]